MRDDPACGDAEAVVVGFFLNPFPEIGREGEIDSLVFAHRWQVCHTYYAWQLFFCRRRLATILLRVLLMFCAEKDHYRERIATARDSCLGEGQDRRHFGCGTGGESDIHQRGFGSPALRYAR